MKNSLPWLLLIPLLMGATADLQPRSSSNQPSSGTSPARGGQEQQLIQSPLDGDYYEAARTGSIYTVTSQGASNSFSTAGVSPLAAAGVAWLALYNPPTSSVNLEILTITVNTISGTPGAGGVQYNLGCSETITAAQNATPVNSRDASAGVAQGYSQTALTGSVALKLVGQSSHIPPAAAITGSTGVNGTYEEPKGKYLVAPGCVFAIQPVAAGTTWLGNGSVTYRQAAP